VLLLAGITNRIAGAASAGLLVVFMLRIASAWALAERRYVSL